MKIDFVIAGLGMAWHVISSWHSLSVFSVSCKPWPYRFAPCENRQGRSSPNRLVCMRTRLLQNYVDALVAPRAPELGRALIEAPVDCLCLSFIISQSFVIYAIEPYILTHSNT